jgi:shikimate dehydrogenase
MAPNIDSSPVDRDTISRFSAVIDLIYNPRRTLFLKYAEELGLKSVNGLYMLIGQAVAAQEIWNNRELDQSFIDKIYEFFV